MSSEKPEPVFRFRLNHLSSISLEPNSFVPAQARSPLLPSDQKFSKLPVIRVYGATEAGQRVCANIWGAFPYLYVPYPDPQSVHPDHVERLTDRLAKALNTAMSLSFRKTDVLEKSTENLKQERTYIAYIALVKGIPFYGYHVGYRYYLKIYILNPRFKTRLFGILKSGRITMLHPPGGASRDFSQEVYEAHIPYELQFLCDFNLYGCGWVDIGEGAKFREPLPRSEDTSSARSGWYTDFHCPPTLRSRFPLSKSTASPLEIDIHVSHILNRCELSERIVHNDFTEWESDVWSTKWKEEKLVSSVKELWVEESERRKSKGDNMLSGRVGEEERPDATKPFFHLPPYILNSFSHLANSSLHAYRQTHPTTNPRADDFVQKLPFERHIPTAFQSTASTFPETWEADSRANNALGVWGTRECVDTTCRREREATVANEEDMREIMWFGSQAAQEMWEKERMEAEKEDKEGIDKAREWWDTLDEEDKDVDKPKPPIETVVLQDISTTTPPPEMRADEGGKSVSNNFIDEELDKSSLTSTKPDSLIQPPFISPHRNFFQPSRKSASVSPIKIASKGESLLEFQSDRVAGPNGPKKFGTPRQFEGYAVDLKREGRLMKLMGNAGIRDQGSDPSEIIPSLPPVHSVVIPTQVHLPSGRAKKVVRITGPDSSEQIAFGAPLSSRHFVNQPCSFGRPEKASFQFSQLPPLASQLLETLENFKICQREYSNAFYGEEKDVPPREFEFGGHAFKGQSRGLTWLQEFKHGDSSGIQAIREDAIPVGIKRWEFAYPPPSTRLLSRTNTSRGSHSDFVAGEDLPMTTDWLLASQMVGPTQMNVPKFSPLKGDGVNRKLQHMGVLAMELHVNTRESFLPDPDLDEISILFYCFQTEAGCGIEDDGLTTGCIGVQSLFVNISKLGLKNLVVVNSEGELFIDFIEKMREFDPEIITGYEIQTSSWGYLISRGKILGFDLVWELGRARSNSVGRNLSKEDDRWGYTHGSTLKLDGRHCLPLWRILRSEVALTRYSFENVVFHVLRKRVPKFTHADFTRWYRGENSEEVYRVFQYYLNKVNMVIQMLDEAEIVTRNAEFARIFGVDFLSVLNRGSQFKVESVMFRIAKPESFILLSPSRDDVGKQNAAECIPLIMEPQSAFYKGPLIVLDFQSLYPSVMIAYNYCYSTCLGRTTTFKDKSKLGVSELNLAPGLIDLLQNHVNISPNGIVFVKSHVRKSLLSKMLTEILDTRVMVKSAMKSIEDDKTFLKMMNARQLGLKYIANVTYGYTSATFSGRMPCVEIADSIVQTGREILERSLNVIENRIEWGAQVVYGDTDSLFVYLPGKTKEAAFRIGNEIADHITSLNLYPVKLKFEKVYLPSILLAKKRYVGFKYESLQDTEPTFDAKGLEVIRRDGTPALQKLEEAAIKILFKTYDISQVKAYVQSQWTRFMEGSLSPLDFVFAKEVRLGTYSENGVPPPGAVVAARKMKGDPRAEPQFHERVPYIIAQSDSKARQVDRALAPDEFMSDPRNLIDVKFYVKQHFINPLTRLFSLVGADVESWWNEMPKRKRAITHKQETGGRLKIEEHFDSSHCIVCQSESDLSSKGICSVCSEDPSMVSYTVLSRYQTSTRRLQDIESICRSCSNVPSQAEVLCANYDCPVLYSRKRAKWKADEVRWMVEKAELL